MIAFRFGLGLGAGLVVAVAAVVLFRSAMSPAETQPPPPQAEQARCPELVQAAREAESLHERKRIAEELLRGLRATEIELIGEPPPWPDDLPDALRPDQIRATVERAFEGTRYTIEVLDCEEFPCLLGASWSVDPEDTDDHTKPSRKLSVAELADKGVANQQLVVSYVEYEDGDVGMEEWAALAPPELIEPQPRARLQHRRRILEAIWEEMAEADAEAADE